MDEIPSSSLGYPKFKILTQNFDVQLISRVGPADLAYFTFPMSYRKTIVNTRRHFPVDCESGEKIFTPRPEIKFQNGPNDL